MNQMGESLGVSVSFGKYENDAALCWEKWSTFSPNNSNNKYLEEVGKCSTPGSVAQKKAFFEAHYKKIAAMKLAEADESTPDDCIQEHGSGKFQEEEDESMPQNTNSAAADNLEAAALVNAESMKLVKQHFHVDLETVPPQTIANQSLLINQNEVEKNSIGMKEKTASVIPKSPETPAGRLPKTKPKATSAPSLKKPNTPSSSSLKKASAPSSSKNKTQSVSESRRLSTDTQSSSLKKASAASLSSKNKSCSVSESRRLSLGTPSSSLKKAPVSLHLSMSMNSVYSDTASSVTSSRRRSLFMEQMGDKDIVKRAFKTFQNRVNQLPSSDSGHKQLPTKRSEQKTWTPMAYQKENERSRKAAAEKVNPARGQLGPTWKSVSSGSLKGIGADERRLKAGPTSVALKSNERSERRKEFFKNLEEKSNARVAERSQLSLKAKEVKDAEMKKVRQKTKAQGVLKST